MSGRKAPPLLLASWAAGALAGCLEAASLALRGILDDPAAAAPFAAGRLALASAIAAIVALLLLPAFARMGPARLGRTRVLALALASALAGFALVLAGWHQRDAPLAAQLLWYPLGACGAWALAAAIDIDRIRAWRLPIAAACAAAGVFLLHTDAARLRGTYPSLALLLAGAAVACLASAIRFAIPFRRMPAAVLLAIAAASSVPLFTGAQPAALLASSDRIRLIDRGIRELGFPAPATPEPSLPEGGAALLSPPEGGDRLAAREAWSRRVNGRPPRNILWITIDALRADCTGSFGGKSTPNLDRLGKEGVVFLNAFSQAPGTAFSAESFTTGRHPSRSALAYAWKAGNVETIQFPPFARWATELGYRTAFITGLTEKQLNHYTFERLKRGFSERTTAAGEPDALETAAAFERWLQDAGAGPWFAWLHFFDPHAPYVPRPGIRANASARELYEGEVRYADEGLRKAVEAVRAAGIEDDTIVLVHSDHSEAFGEQGRYFHSTSYYDSQIHTPLVFRVPGVEPGVARAPAGNVDIFITLCDILLAEPPGYLQGFSLLPTLLDPSLPWPRAAFAETLIVDDDGRWTDERVRMATDGRYKLLDWRSSSMRLLFDRENDPGELRNIAEARPEIAERLLAKLAALDRMHDERDGHRTALASIVYEDVEAALLHGDLPARREVMERLWAGQRPDFIEPLAGSVPKFRPAIAHQVLVMLDDILEADIGDPGPPPPFPPAPSPLRARLIERYATWPSLWAQEIPPLPEPRSAMEQRAILLARAARGDGQARRSYVAPLPRAAHEWDRAAGPLIAGGATEMTPLLLRTFDRPGGRDRAFLRGLKAAMAGDAAGAARVLVHFWPSPTRRIEPSHYAAAVDIAMPLAGEFPDALLALHPEARPADQGRIERRLFELHGIKPLLLKQISMAWAKARRHEETGDGIAFLERAVEALPGGAGTARIREEALAAAVPAPSAAGLALRFRPASGGLPPFLDVRSDRKAGAGPGKFERIDLAWKSDRGAMQRAGTIVLPRIVLSPGEFSPFPVVIDGPRSPGAWRLAAQVPDFPGEIAWTEPPAPVLIEPGAALTPRDLLELGSAWPIPLRLTGGSATHENFEDGHGGLWLPAMPLAGKRVRVRLAATVWPGAEGPFVPLFTIRETGATAPGTPLASGSPAVSEAVLPLPEAETATIEIRWPLMPSLVEISGIEILPER